MKCFGHPNNMYMIITNSDLNRPCFAWHPYEKSGLFKTELVIIDFHRFKSNQILFYQIKKFLDIFQFHFFFWGGGEWCFKPVKANKQLCHMTYM